MTARGGRRGPHTRTRVLLRGEAEISPPHRRRLGLCLPGARCLTLPGVRLPRKRPRGTCSGTTAPRVLACSQPPRHSLRSLFVCPRPRSGRRRDFCCSEVPVTTTCSTAAAPGRTSVMSLPWVPGSWAGQFLPRFLLYKVPTGLDPGTKTHLWFPSRHLFWLKPRRVAGHRPPAVPTLVFPILFLSGHIHASRQWQSAPPQLSKSFRCPAPPPLLRLCPRRTALTPQLGAFRRLRVRPSRTSHRDRPRFLPPASRRQVGNALWSQSLLPSQDTSVSCLPCTLKPTVTVG